MTRDSGRTGFGEVYDPTERLTMRGTVRVVGRIIEVDGHVVEPDGSEGRKLSRTYSGLALRVEWLDSDASAA
jgi:hypothetical protein